MILLGPASRSFCKAVGRPVIRASHRAQIVCCVAWKSFRPRKMVDNPGLGISFKTTEPCEPERPTMNNKSWHFSARWRRDIKPLLVPTILLGALVLSAQDSKPPQSSKPPAPPAPSSTSLLPPVPFDSNATLHHLNQVISWYRRNHRRAIGRIAERHDL